MAHTEWDEQVVHSISAVPASAAEDQRHRQRAYLLAMGIRTGSFALAMLFGPVLDVPWAAWIFIATAVVLPYPAVVLANGRDRHTAPVITGPARAIGASAAGTRPGPGTAAPAASATIRVDATPGGPAGPAAGQVIPAGPVVTAGEQAAAQLADALDRVRGHEVQRPVRTRGWAAG